MKLTEKEYTCLIKALDEVRYNLAKYKLENMETEEQFEELSELNRLFIKLCANKKNIVGIC